MEFLKKKEEKDKRNRKKREKQIDLEVIRSNPYAGGRKLALPFAGRSVKEFLVLLPTTLGGIFLFSVSSLG